jgi:hypothetical protein
MKDRSNVIRADFSLSTPCVPPAFWEARDLRWLPDAEMESPALVVIGFDECAPLSAADLDHLRAAITEGQQ